MNSEWLRRHQIAVFFVLAYSLTWSVQIPAYLLAHREGVTLGNEANLQHVLDLLGGEGHPAANCVS